MQAMICKCKNYYIKEMWYIQYYCRQHCVNTQCCIGLNPNPSAAGLAACGAQFVYCGPESIIGVGGKRHR